MLRRLLLILMGCSALGCAREVIIDLPDQEPRTVVIAHFTDKEPFKVEVSVSQSLFESEPAELPEDVEASISSGGQFVDVLIRTIGDDDRLYWSSRDPGIPGKLYTLTVRVPGYPQVQAGSSIPAHAGLAPISVLPSTITSEPLQDGRRLMRIPLALEVENMPEENRYFAFDLQHEIQVFETINGEIHPNYTYQAGTFFQADGRTLSLLHNTPEPAVLINERFWSDNRRTIFLTALIPYDPESEIPTKIYVEWRTLSEEFYRYHLSLARQGSNLPLSDPDAVYNNVEGGYGNFSGYSVSVDTIPLPK